ncbi:hypothetical protein [Diaphorobacter aerolatus]|uniref:Uncharacterized protein n=1 Tax=Diaphorobacter aerolatus TaxID=1288495 RepID=A0A7H0GII2_9BURK|nr:hypothetical protein [Diaphorobacter aerolatus]QNP48098.1 hypothetical protein H9K75_18825 [Diaphorobacter aerolatus]
MTEPANPAAAPSKAPVGRFDGRVQFEDWLREALRAAADEGWRELILCDGDFRDWPLGDREILEILNQWAAGSRVGGARRCVLMSANFEQLRVCFPRFVQWRTRWEHLLDCRQINARNAADVPSVLWSARWTLQRVDTERSRGVASAEAQFCTEWREKLGEWINTRTRPGFPSTILGL